MNRQPLGRPPPPALPLLLVAGTRDEDRPLTEPLRGQLALAPSSPGCAPLGVGGFPVRRLIRAG